MKILNILLIAWLFVGCSTKHLSPANVSDYFWGAQQKRDYSDVKKFVRQRDRSDVKLQRSIHIKRYRIGKAEKKSADLAYVPTTLYLSGFFKNDPSSEVEVDFDTVLNKDKEGWKVNMKETRKILYIETIKRFGSSMGRDLSDEIRKGLGDLYEFQNIFKDVLKNLADSVKGMKR